jgi:hypothetical protein
MPCRILLISPLDYMHIFHRFIDTSSATKAPFSMLSGELRRRCCMSQLISSQIISFDCEFASINSNFAAISGESALVANMYLLTCFVLSGSARQSQCGVNTFCTGDWFTPSFCSCFDGYSSPTNDGKACTGINHGVLTHANCPSLFN